MNARGFEAEKNMDNVFEQNLHWRWRKKKNDPDYFTASTKSPSYMWIGSSDAPVPASTIMGEDPAKVFVASNIANLVVNTDFNLMGALQYAVETLEIPHIIVCGHYGCRGIKAAMMKKDHGPPLENWLRNIRDVYRLHRKELDAIEDIDQRHRRLVELNVVEQCINLVKTGVVQRKCVSTHQDKEKPFATPRIHACVYDPESGELKRLRIDFSEAIDDLGDIYDLIKDYDVMPKTEGETDDENSTGQENSPYKGLKRRWDLFNTGIDEDDSIERGEMDQKESVPDDTDNKSKLNTKNMLKEIQNYDDIKNVVDIELTEAANAITKRTDYLMESLNREISDLRTAVHLLENYETVAVTWEIPGFERSLTDTRAVYRSNDFPIAGYMMHLEFVVMSAAESQLRHRDREVSVFITNTGGSTFMPIEMAGTAFTLIADDPADDLQCVAETDFKILSANSGFGWTRFTTLNELREKYINIKGSVNMEAVVRVERLKRMNISP